jgi:hypothetical protein
LFQKYIKINRESLISPHLVHPPTIHPAHQRQNGELDRRLCPVPGILPDSFNFFWPVSFNCNPIWLFPFNIVSFSNFALYDHANKESKTESNLRIFHRSLASMNWNLQFRFWCPFGT